MNAITLSVPSMSCGGCAAHIRQLLADIPGVGNSVFDQKQRRIHVLITQKDALATLRAKLAEAGYAATVLSG